jgi:hypothetical protein
MVIIDKLDNNNTNSLLRMNCLTNNSTYSCPFHYNSVYNVTTSSCILYSNQTLICNVNEVQSSDCSNFQKSLLLVTTKNTDLISEACVYGDVKLVNPMFSQILINSVSKNRPLFILMLINMSMLLLSEIFHF